MKVSIGRTTLFDDLELQAFEDELKHLIRDECKRAPELKVRSITLRHSLCHIDCIKKQILCVTVGRTSVRSWISQPSLDGTFYATNTVKLSKMSLAEASEARKARLTALRKRKAGEAVDEEGYVSSRSLIQNIC